MTTPSALHSIAWDLLDGRETFFVLDQALERFAEEERDIAAAEGGNPDRIRWAERAEEMRADLAAAIDRALAA